MPKHLENGLCIVWAQYQDDNVMCKNELFFPYHKHVDVHSSLKVEIQDGFPVLFQDSMCLKKKDNEFYD